MVAAASALLVLPGCAAAEADQGSPWAQEFAIAYDESDSEFIRSILADGVVTPAELNESRQQTLQCMLDAGINASMWEDGPNAGFGFAGDLTPEQHEQMLRCDDQFSGPIPGLYFHATVNPNNDDWQSLVAECLVRHDLAPDGFAAADLDALMKDLPTITIPDGATDEEIEALMAATPQVDLYLPGGHPLNDGVAWECQIDPRT